MCTNLQRFSDKEGAIILRPCRNCSRCKANRLTDLAGRAYAEALSSKSFVALTLTYANSEGASSQVLFYRDVQKFFKRLRSAGHHIRYIIAGEYGSKRGRAHWHCILYFRGSPPDLPPADTECQSWSFWPHGFTYVQRPTYRGLLYVLKYAAKDDGSERTTRAIAMSKKPPLGAFYWRELAVARIDAGLPFSFVYTLPEARYKNGRAVQFWLSGRSLRLAYEAHRAEWFSRGNFSEPPIRDEDFPRIEKAMRAGLNFEAYRSPIASSSDLVPWMQHKDYDRALACVNGDGYLVRLKGGHLMFSGWYKGVIRTWRVRNLQDAIATFRGYRVQSPQRVTGSRAPF